MKTLIEGNTWVPQRHRFVLELPAVLFSPGSNRVDTVYKYSQSFCNQGLGLE